MNFAVVKDEQTLFRNASLNKALTVLTAMINRGDFEFLAIAEEKDDDLIIFHVMLEKQDDRIVNLNAETSYSPGDDVREFLTSHLKVRS